jgi:beta-glucosidase
MAGCAVAASQIGLFDTTPAAARASPALWPVAHSPAALTSPATEAEIDRILARLTLEQKVGQVIQGDISAISPADLARYPLGSILAGGNSGPYGDERADAVKWRKIVDEFRAASVKAGAGIPILFGVDAVHGHSNLPGATIFPHNIGLGAAHDPALIERIGAATAAEISGSGIEWTFAPTLAVPQDLRWGRSYEGYSSDPGLIAAYSRAMIIGLQGPLISNRPLAPKHVAGTAKHFLADGGTFDGRDQGDARIAQSELIARHAQGYPAAIDAGTLTVMVSFSSWNGVKNHGNASLLTGVLKDRMGFQGLVVGDWNGHGQVPGCSATDCAAALNAGIDLFMAPDSWKGLFEATVREVRDGTVPMARLDDAVRRVLRVKFKLGLMGPNPVVRGDAAQVGAPNHLALAREAAAKSLVLLKNEGGLLPLRPGSKVLVTGAGADNMAMQAGGWTITWQGSDTTAADFPNGQTVGRAIMAQIRAAGGEAVLSEDGNFSQRPDVAVVVVGEKPYAEFQGDVPDLAYRAAPEESALIAHLKAQGIKVVTVFLSGRPLFASPLINQSDAFVAAWLPGTQANGVADVLVAQRSGKALRDFTGRLPFAWPVDARSPIVSPLFVRGYGLSYARPGHVGKLSEDPMIQLAAAASSDAFVVRGKVPAPWHLAADGAIADHAADLGAQEDARQFSWSGPGTLSIEGNPVSLARELDEGFVLLLDWRIDRAVAGPVVVSLGGGSLDFGDMIRAAPVGSAVQTYVPLSCFVRAGAQLGSVGAPLRISAPAGFTMTLRTARVEGTGAMFKCPPKAG